MQQKRISALAMLTVILFAIACSERGSSERASTTELGASKRETGEQVAQDRPAEDSAAPTYVASGQLLGSFWRRSGEQKYHILAQGAIGNGPAGLAGGGAAFDAFDSGEIVFIGQVSYVPASTHVHFSQAVRTPSPPFKLEHTPRFLMFCMWSISDGKAGRPVAAYAERDDANARFVREKFFDSASITWVNVPGPRIKEKFKGKDYCGEIAFGRATGVRDWLPEATGKRGASK